MAALMLAFCVENTQTAAANGDTRTITLHHIHTNEDLTITYKRNGRYDADAMKKIDWFMRDWRKAESTKMDPQAIDILWTVQQEIGNGKPIWIVCGYRSPNTNAMLRRRSSGVAEYSQHTLGKAIDFYIPGANLEQTREIGLKLQRGGVGYYPTSGSPFVHMDVGSVRHWPRMSHDQLARVFPDGRTVHIPSDGKPLKNYALALADIETRGSSMPSGVSLASARNAGVDTSAPAKKSLLASIFKGNDSEDDDTAKPAPGARVAAIAADVKTKLESKKLASKSVEQPIRVASAAPEPGSSEKIKPVKVEPVRIEPGQVAAVPSPTPRPLRPTTEAARAVVATLDTATLAKSAIARAILASAGTAKEPAKPLAVADAGNMFTERGVWSDNDSLKQTGASYNAASYKVASADTTAAVSAPLGYAAVLTHAPRAADAAPVEIVRPLRVAHSINDIWTRAMMIAPDLKHFMSATLLGVQDPKELRPLMKKPNATLAMTFSEDPSAGLTTSEFTGNAVVFLENKSLVTRTAMLDQ